MNLKHIKWAIVVVAVIVLSMTGAMVWASSPADVSEIVPLATPGLDADKVDGADAVDSWAPATQRAGNVVKTMSNGRINPASFPLGYFDGRYLNASNINAGTLNNARFSAYSDLSSEGRIDCSTGSDLCTRSSSDDRYVNAGTKYLSIHAVAFQAEGEDFEAVWYDGYMCQNYDYTRYFRAPVHLPHGATVTGVYGYYYDTDVGANEDVAVWLNRVNKTGGFGAMTGCNSTAGPGWSSCSDTSVGSPVIDNWNYSYQVTVRLTCDCAGTAQHRLSMVVIRYTEP